MCVLIYFLLIKLFKIKNNNTPINNLELIALATTLLFAAHPIHTEAVANIKGRDEIMTLLGSLSAVWFALKYYENTMKINKLKMLYSLLFVFLLG